MSKAVSSIDDPLAILDDYDFDLPEASIAQTALVERDQARLLVLNRDTGELVQPDRDGRVRDLTDWLRPNDLLVVNATKVLPARLVGRKSTGGAAEVLLLGPDEQPLEPNAVPEVADDPAWAKGPCFRALLKCTGRVRAGLEFRLGQKPGLAARIEALYDRGEVRLRFAPGTDPYSLGVAPLPPYIRRPNPPASPSAPDSEANVETPNAELAREDLSRYQTIYAREPGAIAAPTAGLHFTPALLEDLEARGIERAEVVLHVGAGTFRPLDREALESGRLHSERFELPAETVRAIERARRAGGRVVAVGTTTARVLESCVEDDGSLRPGQGQTRLFIRPGGPPFRVVDALLTNFHLPRSSLLMLVAAFVGREPMLAAYRHAIARGFRFYSYGDAMLILPDVRLPEEDDSGASRAA